MVKMTYGCRRSEWRWCRGRCSGERAIPCDRASCDDRDEQDAATTGQRRPALFATNDDDLPRDRAAAAASDDEEIATSEIRR